MAAATYLTVEIAVTVLVLIVLSLLRGPSSPTSRRGCARSARCR